MTSSGPRRYHGSEGNAPAGVRGGSDGPGVGIGGVTAAVSTRAPGRSPAGGGGGLASLVPPSPADSAAGVAVGGAGGASREGIAAAASALETDALRDAFNGDKAAASVVTLSGVGTAAGLAAGVAVGGAGVAVGGAGGASWEGIAAAASARATDASRGVSPGEGGASFTGTLVATGTVASAWRRADEVCMSVIICLNVAPGPPSPWDGDAGGFDDATAGCGGAVGACIRAVSCLRISPGCPSTRGSPALCCIEAQPAQNARRKAVPRTVRQVFPIVSRTRIGIARYWQRWSKISPPRSQRDR